MSGSYIASYYYDSNLPVATLDICAGDEIIGFFYNFDNMRDASPYLASIGREIDLHPEYNKMSLRPSGPNVIVFYSADGDIVLTC